ncbi:MAG TPA: hypothetical protein VH083_10475 [Myxococcales bacterium]|jgi:hypothetical protein|nr:hypothetical protein [Myxococcales bacterium]
MKLIKALGLVLLVGACAHGKKELSLVVEEQLAGAGVEGWIHGAVEGQGEYVLTYRTPGQFFDYLELSLVARDDNVAKQLASFKRHDKVRVKGAYMDHNPSPQKHILVSSIELLKKYESVYAAEAYQYQAKIPEELLEKTSETFLVHAIGGNGQILVLQYKDAILPVFVRNGLLTKDLYRGDLVKLSFKIQRRPKEPVHLNLDETQPVEVLESIKALNGQKTTIEGALVLFPKSPEIVFNVFAVRQSLQGGLDRQFTLVNFEDPEIFKAVREKLQKAWDDEGSTAYVNGRNKLVSTKIRIRATGTLNDVDPSQANPQILLDSADAVQIIQR